MAAVVTDQFRILNASNFVDSVLNENNSYYVFLGLSNPTDPNPGFGRTTTWNQENDSNKDPVDNLDYLSHYGKTSLFGKKITNKNIRRVIRKVNWSSNTRYEMYRHDYSSSNPTPNSDSSRLYDSNFYVMNSDFKVYICIDNGSSVSNLKGNKSQDEPTFTDLEPSSAGTSGDGYIWKYLFSIAPSDIIKFDSTEYIVVPNDWSTSTDPQIQNVREAGDSNTNLNQLKAVYIAGAGNNYIYNQSSPSEECNIIGDGTGAKALVTVSSTTKIESVKITAGGSGYTYGYVDLSPLRPGNHPSSDAAKLIPIIPPSKGHGSDIYTELGADRVLVYARFDDSTRDFPTNTKFAQVGIIKNPESFGSTSIFTDNQYSSLSAMKVTTTSDDGPDIGATISQTLTGGTTAKGYVASYDKDTKVLKYYTDRTLCFQNNVDSTDNVANSEVLKFSSDGEPVTTGDFTGSIDSSFGDGTPTNVFDGINLGVTFTNGLADPEINRKTGDIIYIDNRTLVTRDSRQKEDVKIILEF